VACHIRENGERSRATTTHPIASRRGRSVRFTAFEDPTITSAIKSQKRKITHPPKIVNLERRMNDHIRMKFLRKGTLN